MVDNFELIKSLLKFENDGDCYYVQLLRRAADDPKPNGVPDPKYHGNMHSRSIKDYFIKSVDHLESVKDEIIELCKMFSVRAYIRLNKRTYKHIALAMLKHIAEQEYSGQSFSSPFHMVSSAAGTACSAGKEKTWIFDLDKEYLPYEDEIKHLICGCTPFSKEIVDSDITEDKFIAENMTVIPTKSGKHIVVKPFNKQTFGEQWKMFNARHCMDLKVPDIHKDNPTILYVP